MIEGIQPRPPLLPANRVTNEADQQDKQYQNWSRIVQLKEEYA
jgi:hypothetical protein